MSDNRNNEFIRVYCRVRPFSVKEASEGKKCVRCRTPYIEYVGENRVGHKFVFNSVFDETSTQEDLFNAFGKEITDNCLMGYNGCIFAYGQTGSGKTHTILGLETSDGVLIDDQATQGLLPRILVYMFDEIRKRETQDNVHYSCFVSFMEIYNEKIRDLLDPVNSKKETASNDHRIAVENLSIVDVNSAADASHFVQQGLTNRRVGVTNMNMRSSRSHAVFTFYLTCEEVQSDITVTRKSQFHLIDLAGSERQTLTGTGGESLKEACFINSSLSALGNVIRSLTHQEAHIPYRDSKLTYLLRDSLGGNSLTAIIATVSPATSAASETLSTLRFATDAKMIKNMAVVNEVRFGSIAALQQEISRLQQEVNQLRASHPIVDSPGFSSYLLRELSSCNRTCSELYCTIASLLRDLNGMKGSYLRLRSELRTKEGVIERILKGLFDKDEYIQSLKSSVSHLLQQNLDWNTNSLLLEKYRLLLRQENSSDDTSDSILFSTLSTLTDLHKELARVENQSLTNSTPTDEEFGIIHKWIANEKQILLQELEEVRSRCNELYADLVSCQEQLRVEHLRQELAFSEKRIRLDNSYIPYSQLLVQTDCQRNIMREQRRIIAHQEQQIRSFNEPLQIETVVPQETSVCCNESLQLANSFYHQLCSTAREHEQQVLSPIKEDTSELQGEIERLQRQIEEKDADIEKLKFDLLDLNNQFEAEKASNRELVVQASDRLQQIVELQTSLELQRQMTRSDSDRLHQLEEQMGRLVEEKMEAQEQVQLAEKELQQCQEKEKQLEEEMERARTEAVIQQNVVSALTAAVREHTADNTEKERKIEELDAQKAALERRCRLMQEEEEKSKIVLENQSLSVQALTKRLEEEKERNLQLNSEIERYKQREGYWKQENATFSMSLERIESMLIKDRSEWQEALEVTGKSKKLDSIYQKNLSINQLKDENRRLIAKLEIARKRMTNYGLSTSDIDVNSEELSFYNRISQYIEELKKICSLL